MTQNRKPFIVGITGSIGSGKSEVSRYIVSLGYPLIDADIIAREVVNPGEIGLIKLVEHFGDAILNDNGSLNRRRLGEIVFSNTILLNTLNGILHPLIHQQIQSEIQRLSSSAIVFVDVPLLFETDTRQNYDEVILVFAPIETCLERIIKRDDISKELAMAKLKSQMDPELKRSLSDYEICNNKDLVTLRHQVDVYLEHLVKRVHKSVNI